MSQTNEERAAEIQKRLAALLSGFDSTEIQMLASSIITHFEEREREDQETLIKYAALLKGVPEVGITPDPKMAERIERINFWRKMRAKGIEVFNLVREQAMIAEAPAVVASILAANGHRPKPKMKKADARVVEPKAIEPQGS